MQLFRILGRSLVDCFCRYVWPLIEDGGAFAPEADRSAERRPFWDGLLEAVEAADLERALQTLDGAPPGLRGTAGVRLIETALLADLGRCGEARRVLEALLEQHRDDGRLWLMSGQLAERGGGIERAIQCYRTAMDLPGLAGCQAAERLAAIYVATEDFAAARDALRWLVEVRPGEFRTRVELAAVLSRTGDVDGAIAAYEDAILLDPDDWQARDDLAAELERAGRFDDALNELERALEAHPDFADLHLRAARLCGRQGRLEAALRHADTAVAANPRYLEGQVFRGVLLTELGRPAEAVAAFECAIQRNDEYVAAYVGLAAAQERAGRHADSAETMELARRIAPSSDRIYARMVRLGVGSVVDPDDGPAPGGADATAGDTADEGDYDERMRRQLERHRDEIGRHPRFADLRYHYGLLLASVGRRTEATEQFQAAVEINPRYIEALGRLALGCWRDGRTDEALHALEKAHRVAGAELAAHYRFALTWTDRGLWPLTIDALRRRRDAEALAGAASSGANNLGFCAAIHSKRLPGAAPTDRPRSVATAIGSPLRGGRGRTPGK